jgi:hypothetical protein
VVQQLVDRIRHLILAEMAAESIEGGERRGNVIVDFAAATHSVGLRRKPQ